MRTTLREKAIASKRAELDSVRAEVLGEREELARHNEEVLCILFTGLWSSWFLSYYVCRIVAVARFI